MQRLVAILCILSAFQVCHTFKKDWFQYEGYDYYLGHVSGESNIGWYKAREMCMKEGADLASYTSKTETQYVQNKIYKLNPRLTSGFWIGLTRFQRENFEWSDGTTLSFTNWYSGNPNSKPQHCGYVLGTSSDDRWRQLECAMRKGFVCKRPSTAFSTHLPKTETTTADLGGYCPQGYFSYSANKCFRVVIPEDGIGLSWLNAQTECKAIGPGRFSDLATISSEEENAIVTSQIQGSSIMRYWIGLGRTSTSYPYGWSDNSPVTYTNWERGIESTSGYRVYMMSQDGFVGKWKGEYSSTTYKGAYICQTFKDPSNFISTPGPTTPHTCKNGYIPYWYGCYKFMDTRASYNASAKSCDEEEDGNLVSIHHEAENSALMLLSAGREVWIGLKHDDKGEYHWVDNWMLLYTKWGKNQPDPEEGGGCVAMGTDGHWYDRRCDKKLPYICKQTDAKPITTPPNPEGSCPLSADWKPFGPYCYAVTKSASNWLNGMGNCRKLHPDAKPASITSLAESISVTDFIQTATTYTVIWIGLHKAADGSFVWHDKKIVDFTNWAGGYPLTTNNYDCSYMGRTTAPGTWKNYPCTYSYPMLCKVPKGPLETPPPDHPGKCPNELWKPYGSRCLLFQPNVVATHTLSLEDCKVVGGEKATLATVNNIYEHRFIADNMREKHSLPMENYYWIGLVRNTKDRTKWIWLSNGEEAKFTNWGAGQPSMSTNYDCVDVRLTTGDWYARTCTLFKGHVCEVPKEYEQSNSDDLSGGAVAGIIIGVLLSLALISASIWWFAIRRETPTSTVQHVNVMINRHSKLKEEPQSDA